MLTNAKSCNCCIRRTRFSTYWSSMPLLRFTCVIVSVSPLNGVRQRLTPSHGAACEPWPWPVDVAAVVWALTAVAAELAVTVLPVWEAEIDVFGLVKLLSACGLDPLAWLLFGCGARKKLFVVSLVPKPYKRIMNN